MEYRTYGLRRWILVAAFVAAAGACYSCGRKTVSLQSYVAVESAAGPAEETAMEAAVETVSGDADGLKNIGESAAGAESGAVCYVHICGAVASPGVYEVAKGQRIYQVVELAGGYTQEAATDYLNLAAEVEDGMKLVVPTREELLSASGESLYGVFSQEQDTAEPKKVNLNTAGREELMELSGIGEAKAGDIIRYREEHGGFQTIEDIMKVPGIKEAAFQKIRDRVTV